MTASPTPPVAREPHATAVEWAVRIERDAMDAEAWLEFSAWSSTPAHLEAFEAVQARLGLIDEAVCEGASGQSAVVALIPGAARRPRAQGMWWVGSGAIAASLVVAVFGGRMLKGPTTQPVEFSAPGVARDVALADRSTVSLRAGSALTAAFSPKRRAVTLRLGSEAAFDVTKDQARPFEIVIGDRTIRVVGTAFDVKYMPGVTRVAVSRGVVQVMGPGAPAGGVTLRVGQAVTIGSSGAPWSIGEALPRNVGAWRRQRLIFDNQSVADVAREITAATDIPVEVGPRVGALRYSGVLRLGSADQMARALELYLPVRADASGGRIALNLRRGGR